MRVGKGAMVGLPLLLGVGLECCVRNASLPKDLGQVPPHSACLLPGPSSAWARSQQLLSPHCVPGTGLKSYTLEPTKYSHNNQVEVYFSWF